MFDSKSSVRSSYLSGGHFRKQLQLTGREILEAVLYAEKVLRPMGRPNVDPGSVSPLCINMGVSPVLVGICHFWRGTPPY